MMVACSIGIFKKERPLDGDPRARCLFRKRVEIRHQTVALFDKSPADRLRLSTADPWFMVAGPFLGVIPVDGLERSNLKPFCEQVLLRCSCESADVRSTQRKTTQAEIFEHRCCQAKMIPCGTVVTGPGCRITLSTGVAGARQHEWPQVRIELLQPIEGSSRVFHPVQVVNLRMSRCTLYESWFFDAVHHVFGHRLRRSVEDRRLIHVIPKAGNAHF